MNSSKVFPIHDIPNFSARERIVVVGIIGKSSFRYPNKTTPLLSSVECGENGIECHWDERRGILYLVATTDMDSQRLAELTANLDENANSTDKDADAAHWLVASGELATAACRAMALIFHLAHIVVLSSPSSTFDLGYLQLFKAIDAFRTELLPRTNEALLASGAGGAFETHGRACCPRLVFHFRRAPTALRRSPQGLKRLEHAVEDQLYFILRKARIITNVCAKSLFAIPKNEEFVYMSAEDELLNARDISTLVRGLVSLCGGGLGPTVGGECGRGLQSFLQGHIGLALQHGFHDDVGKYAANSSFFQLPSAASWRVAAQTLAPLYLSDGDPAPAPAPAALTALHNALATDVRFSQARCAKVLPIAQASYTEGLPAHYSSQHHAHKVSIALGVLDAMARGPLAGGARARLRAACDAVWAARRLCEAPSLTAHPCIEAEHDNTVEHSSGVRYISACNCGRTKCSRDDPYSVKRANYTFYVQAADECGNCPTLQAIDFPVFQPSTPTYSQPQSEWWSPTNAHLALGAPLHVTHDVGMVARSGYALRAASVRGASSQDDLEPSERGGSASGSSAADWSPGLSPPSPSPDAAPPVPLTHAARPEKVMSRQPSTTEYLPGMLHLASPAGLLPAYSSWSLVCVGPSSLYSHSLGLGEHLQPGFLPTTNYLLPWDAAPRSELTSAWRSMRGRGKGGGSHHVTVKIFIGFEYECPRGHRLMMSSPDTVVSGGSGGNAHTISSVAGAKLAQTNMPLCVPCLCRQPSASYLTRIHVVTPKAPLHVTLDPKAQPVTGGPIFVPQPADLPSIKLSASAYWVLRLPYVYCGERGVLPRPTTEPQHCGTFLAPLFGLQD